MYSVHRHVSQPLVQTRAIARLEFHLVVSIDSSSEHCARLEQLRLEAREFSKKVWIARGGWLVGAGNTTSQKERGTCREAWGCASARFPEVHRGLLFAGFSRLEDDRGQVGATNHYIS